MNSKSATDAVSDLLQVLEDGKEGFHRSAEAVSDPKSDGLILGIFESSCPDGRGTAAINICRP